MNEKTGLPQGKSCFFVHLFSFKSLSAILLQSGSECTASPSNTQTTNQVQPVLQKYCSDPTNSISPGGSYP